MVFLPSLYYVLSARLFIMMMMMNLVFSGPTGLTLKLIHRDSPESPLYPGNLTKLERMERAFQKSIDREQKLLSTWHRMKQQVSSRNNSTNNNSKSGMDTVRPQVKSYDAATYMVQLGIGTFSNVPGSLPLLLPFYYYFYFDTGSDLLWLQCDNTNTGTTRTSYFRQNDQLYPGLYSLTYNLLPYSSNDRVCRKYASLGVPPEGLGFCGYRVRYADGSSSEGALATEKLTVLTDNGGTDEIQNFVFGCGFRQVEPDFGRNAEGQNPIVGILGLGGGVGSFIRQLGNRVQNKFEYCLKPKYDDDHPDTHTFLRFGSDTKIVNPRGPGVQTTRTIPMRGETLYYVRMEGISVDGIPVDYPDGGTGSSVFQTRQDGSGGCVFDTGTEDTSLYTRVYDPFRDHLVTYLNITSGIIRRNPIGRFIGRYDLCFQRPTGFVSFPIIRFHFSGGAVFQMETDSVFDFESRMFCSTIRRSRLRNAAAVLLGSTLLTNHRILHDLGARTISWVNENCAAYP